LAVSAGGGEGGDGCRTWASVVVEISGISASASAAV
jgi:hypothetical protein